MQVQGRLSSASSHHEAMPYHDAHAPQSLDRGICVTGLECRSAENRPLVSADLAPSPSMRYRAGSRRSEFVEACGCLVCGAGNAGLAEIGAGFLELGGSMWDPCKTYGNMARMGIRGAWGSARHGLQCMACEMWDCGLCNFL